MKYFAVLIVALLSFSLTSAGCNKKEKSTDTNPPTGSTMKITIGTAVFTATLYDNPTATAFKEMLPMTITMSELNGNEKYYYFSTTLPVNASNVGSIQNGDLMLYGNNCLVLFYESFSTSYSYTKLGKINNVSGLVEALGTGNVTVKFELE